MTKNFKKKNKKQRRWKLILPLIGVLLLISLFFIIIVEGTSSGTDTQISKPSLEQFLLLSQTNPINCTGTSLPPLPWKESYDPQDEQTYCLNDSILFISQNISFAYNINKLKMVGAVSYADMYINNVNYNSQSKLSNNATPVTFGFNYSIPSWDIPEKLRPYFGGNETYCPIGDVRYGIYVSNDNMDNFNNESFYTGGKELFRYGECDTWYDEIVSIPDLKITSINFSLNSKRIGSAGFEMPNVKIDLNSMRICRNENCNYIY